VLRKINENKELRAKLEAIPKLVEKTVEELTPVDTGETLASIEVKSRRSELKRLSTRRTKLGTVFSDDDPERVNSIEFGRGAESEHGGTEGAYMFTRAAARWQDAKL
jgi:hypothetical protein